MPNSASPLLLNRIRMCQLLLMLGIHEYKALSAAIRTNRDSRVDPRKTLHECKGHRLWLNSTRYGYSFFEAELDIMALWLRE